MTRWSHDVASTRHSTVDVTQDMRQKERKVRALMRRAVTRQAARAGEGLRRHRRWLFALVVVVLLAEMAFAMVTTAVKQTPTIDEPVYVGTAVVYLQQHSLRYNPEHPPLGKLLIASGTAFADPHLDRAFVGDQTELGRHLLYESGNDPWRLMLWARLPVIVLTLLFGLVVLAFARDLAGPVGGLVALGLYAFSPDIIAHGSLATLDVPAAGFLLTSVWLLWRARRRPRRCLPLAGGALGAAVATKMSVLPAVPVLLLLVVLSVCHARRTHNLGPAGGCGFSCSAWRPHRSWRWSRSPWCGPPTSPSTRSCDGPVPRPCRSPTAARAGRRPAPVPGAVPGRYAHPVRLREHGVGRLPVRPPLPRFAVVLPADRAPDQNAAGHARAVADRSRRRRDGAPAAVRGTVRTGPHGGSAGRAMSGSRDLGVRYALFMPMFLAVAAAGVAVFRRRAAHIASAALILCVAVSSLRTYPYYLPYSNEAFGGPARTHLRLHDSNVDWGQDLGRLATRLRQRYPDEKIWLVYKGSGVPSFYGIDASDPRKVPPSEVHGLLVVSDSSIAKADDRLATLINTSARIDEVGHSITIYRRATRVPGALDAKRSQREKVPDNRSTT